MTQSSHENPPEGDEPLQATLTPADALALAVTLHRQGRLLEAELIYGKILAAVPNQPDALHYLGVLSCQLGKTDEAVWLIQRAIAQAPRYVDAYNSLGNVFSELGRWDDAAAAYRKALELDPNLAEAHHNLGLLLRREGRAEDAAAEFRRAIELNPKLEGAQIDLAATLAGLRSKGRLEEAAQVVRRWLQSDPENPAAQHLLAAYTGQDMPARAPAGYIRRVFDSYAAKYDERLVALDYRGPELVAKAVARQCAGRPPLDILDAGCGTGLSGVPLKPCAGRLVGIDLSPAMLAAAGRRGIYDELIAAELTEYLSGCEAAYDLIVSVDTLNYFGDLLPTLNAARGALRPDGVLVFTLEADEHGADSPSFRLNPTGRYSHTRDYITRAVSEAGLTLASMTCEPLRTEFKHEVMGWVVTCIRPPT